MPNWIQTKIQVYGNSREVKSCINTLLYVKNIDEKPKLQQEKAVSITGSDEFLNHSNNRFDNYLGHGFKVIVYNITGICGEDYAHLYFDLNTAWVAPVQLLVEASKKFPLLHFKLRYCEPNACTNVVDMCSISDGEIAESCTEEITYMK